MRFTRRPRLWSPTLCLALQWICLLAACCLSACGGQPGAATDNNPGTHTPAPGDNPTSLALAGAFQGTLYDSDFVIFVTPGMDLYALYFLQTGSSDGIYPDIYRGTLGNVGTDSASIANPGLTAFQYKTHSTPSGLSHLTTGGASISGASTAGFDMALTSISLSNSLPPRFSGTAISTLPSIDGAWYGTWADALGDIQTRHTLTISGGEADTGFGYCRTMHLTLTAAPESSAHPYFLASLSITPQTSCTRAPSGAGQGELSGIGFVHGTRLELILTDRNGSGISFSGALQP